MYVFSGVDPIFLNTVIQPCVAVGMELLCKRSGILRTQEVSRTFSGQRNRNIGLLGKVNEPETKEYIEIRGTIAERIAQRDKKNKSSAK